MTPTGYEVNFDGLIGPTYNFSGLSFGNLASMGNKLRPANPKLAALQGLEKMKLLADLGLHQGVIPPHERPHIPTIRAMGYEGSDRLLPEKMMKNQPELFVQLCSASSAWAANIATTTPSVDSADGKVHITPANMITKPHRALEASFNTELLKKIFPSKLHFTITDPLPLGDFLSDEGSANHCRFCQNYTRQGVNVFIYGRSTIDPETTKPEIYPARQTKEAGETIQRLHDLYPERTYYYRQNPIAIDHGVFHNDVISTNNQNLFLYHEEAFENTDTVIRELSAALKDHCNVPLIAIPVPAKKIPIEKAIRTYLFNSQIVTLQDGSMALIAPIECRDDDDVNLFLETLFHDPDLPIRDIHYVNLTESLRNGGGPACLRQRIVLTQDELNEVHSPIMMNDRLYAKLTGWVERFYRDELLPEDLADPQLVDETRDALNELTRILDLGPIYPFQR